MSGRRIFFDLVRSDFRKKYLGSYLGVLWAFVNPLVTIAIFIFVFQIGLKATPVQDVPFALWLIVGITPWFYFSEALTNSTNAIGEYNFLVKKILFEISYLPVMKIVSALMVHLFFLGIVVGLLLANQISFSWYWFQSLYYLFAECMLLLALSAPLSAMTVFVRDFQNGIGVVLQCLFWLTPILWNLQMIPPRYFHWIKLNPLLYIVQGYRDSFLFSRPFWHSELVIDTLYFWSLTFVVGVVGWHWFKKVKPYFADVL